VFGVNGQWIAEALSRDIRVVSDKPVAASWERLEQLGQLTDDTHRILITEFDARCDPAFRAAHLAVASGRIGGSGLRAPKVWSK
jgi:predicted dehydrogenase